MITAQPAPVSTSAAVAPAGPVPMMTASQSRVESVTTADLVVGVAARLGVARELARVPACERAVAAVLGRAVRAFARMFVQDATQLALRVEPAVLFATVEIGEVVAERADALAIDLLPAAHRTVELAL